MPLTPTELETVVSLLHKMADDDAQQLVALRVFVRTAAAATMPTVLGTVLSEDVAEADLYTALGVLTAPQKSGVVSELSE
jgi:hypothetical protein